MNPDSPQIRRAFWGVMLSFLAHGLIVSTWVSRIASVKSLLRMSDGTFGLALLGTAIGSVTAIPLCGALVTRYGSRHAARWTGAGFCLALMLPPLATDARGLFLALLVFGAMAGASDVAINAQAVATEKLLGKASMSRFHSMFSAGGIAGAVAGGFIASRQVTPLPHLAVAGGFFLLLAILSPRLISESQDTPPASGIREKSARNGLRSVPAPLIALSAIGFCIFLSEGAVADWAGVYLKQVLGASDGLAPAGYAVFSAAMAIFRFAGDAITTRLGRPLTIRLGGTIAAAGVGCAVFAHSPLWALAGFAATGAGFSSIIPLVFAAGGRVESVPEGAGVATVSGIGYLGFLAGPPAIGLLSELTSLRAGLSILIVLSATAAILVSVVERTSTGSSNPLSATRNLRPAHVDPLLAVAD